MVSNTELTIECSPLELLSISSNGLFGILHLFSGSVIGLFLRMIKFVSRGLKAIDNMHFSLNEYIKPLGLKGFIIQNDLERKREKKEKFFSVKCTIQKHYQSPPHLNRLRYRKINNMAQGRDPLRLGVPDGTRHVRVHRSETCVPGKTGTASLPTFCFKSAVPLHCLHSIFFLSSHAVPSYVQNENRG